MNDIYFMKIALDLASRAQGDTSPNPLVGALVVKNGKIIGKGYHRRAGGSHAEVFALKQAGNRSIGAMLYVTLEPCSHFGKTPPCLDIILDSGIKRVVIGMKDPNPLNNGRSIRMLKKRGVSVKVGILEDELKKINAPFIKYITKKMAYITVKVGQSLDGKIATRLGDSKWITSEASRVYAHKLRKYYDAILVGINTVLYDNPRLTNPYSKKQPIKIIVDSKLRISPSAKILRNPQSVIIATSPSYSKSKFETLRKRGAKFFISPNKGRVNLKLLFKDLTKLEITNILVEGGGQIIGDLFDNRLVDKAIFFVAPKIIGGEKALDSVSGIGINRISQAIKLKDINVKNIGNDLMIEGQVN